MNQVRDWEGFCQRCGKSSDIHTMSMFDVALICLPCVELERTHPDYPRACDAESDALKKGDTNFKGIGYPNSNLANDPVDW